MTDEPLVRPSDVAPRDVASRVDYISQITPNLFISDVTSAQCADALFARGITMVVKVFSDDPRNGAYTPIKGLRYRVIPAQDTPGFNMLEWMLPITLTIASELRRGGRVLVHCHMGISRSATVLAAYLIAHGFTAEQAVEALRSVRPVVRPNDGFMEQLKQFEAMLT